MVCSANAPACTITRAVLLRVEVDQLDDGGRRIDAGYQGGHRGGQPRAPPVGVVVADPGLLQPAVVDDLRAAPGELDQGLGDDRVGLLPQVDVGLGDVDVAVGPHAGEPVAGLGLRRGQDLLRVVRVVAGQEREPRLFVPGLLLAAEGADGPPVVSGSLAQFLQPLPVGRVIAMVPQGHRDDASIGL